MLGLLTTLLQIGRWRLEPVSLLLGLILGMLLLLGVQQLWPRLATAWRSLRQRATVARGRLAASGSERYQEELQALLERYHLDGATASLSEIVVTPRFLQSLAEPEEEEALAALLSFTRLWPELAQPLALPPQPILPAAEMLAEAQRLALVGLPGSGKSTALAWLALQTLPPEDGTEPAPHQQRLPVFLHVQELMFDADGAEAALLDALGRRASTLLRPRLAAYWRDKMAAGEILLFLDGLDELTAPQRLPALEWLGGLLQERPKLPVIMAAPAYGYGPLLKLGFLLSELPPWQGGQVHEQQRRWQALRGGASLPPLGSYWRPGQSPLIARLRLLLAAENLPQPARRVELFETALRYLLPAADAEPAWLAPVARELWEQLAWAQLRSPAGYVGRAELEGYAAAILTEYEETASGATGRLLEHLAENDLFHVWPNGHIALRSPLWRDYLAASYLAQLGDSGPIQEGLENRDWQDVRLFFVGRHGAAELAEAMLQPAEQSLRQPRLFEAASWLTELSGDMPWQKDVLARLGRLAMQPESPLALRQRAIAAVALTQRHGLHLFLEQLLRRGEPAIQQTAIAALTLLPAQSALELLETLLAVEGQPALLQGAVRALGALTHPVAQRMLLKLLLEADELTSAGVAEQFAWQGGEGWELLQDAATDEDHEVRRAASYGLAQIGEPWALRLLAGLEEDSEWIVNAAAASALELLERERASRSWRPARLGDQPWLVAWGASQQKVVPAGSAAEPILLDLLANGAAIDARCAAAATLGQFALPAARRPLHQLVQQEDAPLRDAAYNALCLINRAY